MTGWAAREVFTKVMMGMRGEEGCSKWVIVPWAGFAIKGLHDMLVGMGGDTGRGGGWFTGVL